MKEIPVYVYNGIATDDNGSYNYYAVVSFCKPKWFAKWIDELYPVFSKDEIEEMMSEENIDILAKLTSIVNSVQFEYRMPKESINFIKEIDEDPGDIRYLIANNETKYTFIFYTEDNFEIIDNERENRYIEHASFHSKKSAIYYDIKKEC